MNAPNRRIATKWTSILTEKPARKASHAAADFVNVKTLSSLDWDAKQKRCECGVMQNCLTFLRKRQGQHRSNWASKAYHRSIGLSLVNSNQRTVWKQYISLWFVRCLRVVKKLSSIEILLTAELWPASAIANIHASSLFAARAGSNSFCTSIVVNIVCMVHLKFRRSSQTSVKASWLHHNIHAWQVSNKSVTTTPKKPEKKAFVYFFFHISVCFPACPFRLLLCASGVLQKASTFCHKLGCWILPAAEDDTWIHNLHLWKLLFVGQSKHHVLLLIFQMVETCMCLGASIYECRAVVLHASEDPNVLCIEEKMGVTLFAFALRGAHGELCCALWDPRLFLQTENTVRCGLFEQPIVRTSIEFVRGGKGRVYLTPQPHRVHQRITHHAPAHV